MNTFSEKFNNLLPLALIVVFPFFPEISLVIYFVISLLSLNSFSVMRKGFFFLPAVCIFFINTTNIVLGFVQLIFLFGIKNKIEYTFKNPTKFLPFLTIVLISIIVLNSQFNKSFQWNDFNKSTLIQTDYLTKISPNDSNNSLALTNIGNFASQKIRYKLKVRASNDLKLRVSFWLPDTRISETIYCTLAKIYSDCQISIEVKARTNVILVLGEAKTWIENDPYIEIESTQLFVDDVQQLFAWSLPSQRWKGFSFNENAFGAHMALIGLIILAYARNYIWAFLAMSPTLLCVFLSGSRGALAALAIGFLVFFLSRSRIYKCLPWILFLALAGIIIFQAVTLRSLGTSAATQPNLRSLNVLDKDSARTRLEIWRLANKAWLENPRTFLIGTGDLASVMKVKLDARAISYGLTKNTLTHAHNLWLQTAGESGLLGLLAMVWLWGWVILRAWRSRDAGALALLAAIFVMNSVDYLFFYAPVHLAFWMAAAGLKRPEPAPVLSEGSAILTP